MSRSPLQRPRVHRRAVRRRSVGWVVCGLLAVLGTAAAAQGKDAPRDLLPCVYATAGPDGEMAPRDDCARLGADGGLTVEPSHVDAMHADDGLLDDGLASVLVSGSWYYVDAAGQGLRVLTYDNGPDPWQGGLARGLRDGRMIYFDRSFEPVIDAGVDWGWPFEDGLALVCRGCRLDGEAGDEHRALVDGQWGYIDRAGAVRVAFTGTREDAAAARQALRP